MEQVKSMDFSIFEQTTKTEFELGKFEVSFKSWNDQKRGKAAVVLRSQPSPNIRIIVFDTDLGLGDGIQLAFLGDSISEVMVDGVQVDGYFGGSNKEWGDNSFEWQPRIEPLFLMQVVPDVDEFGFFLFDFRDFRNGKKSKLPPLVLQHRGLEMSISEVPFIADSIQATLEDGIPRLTHEVRVSSDAPISNEQVSKSLGDLHDFFSFVAGKRCFAVCPWGKKSGGGQRWQAYSSPFYERGSAGNWFGGGSEDQLAELFSGFMSMRESKLWSRPLHEAIYWFLNANNSTRGVDAGIILAQSALELLAYNYVVNDRGLMTSQGFKDISRASDKLRLLLRSLLIDTAIPSNQTEMNRVVADRNNNANWIDLPHAITEVRNSLVHPESKNRSQFSAVYREAWMCSLWLLELSILRIVGYDGMYSSRVGPGPYKTYGKVPWAKEHGKE